MKGVRWVTLLAVLAVPARIATAQEGALAGEFGFGGPLGAVATAELIHGLRADVEDDAERVKARAGLLLQVHGGSGGGKFSLGVGARARIDSEDFKGTLAAGLKLSLLHTWGSPVGAEPGLTYLGPEIDLSAMHVGLSLGPLFRVGGDGGSAVLFSIGVGFRF
jgi:hypothetical protein